mgnify:CR=1 FL=1
MQELVEQLVKQKREGDWWDFKKQHHSNLHDLLHDLLCLANIIYDEDRFIIFGVSDDYEITGLSENDVRYTQADIFNFLRSKSFAYHKIPNVKLDSILIRLNKSGIFVYKGIHFVSVLLSKSDRNVWKGKAAFTKAVFVVNNVSARSHT